MPENQQDNNPNDIDLEQPGRDERPIPTFPEPKINPYPMAGGNMPLLPPAGTTSAGQPLPGGKFGPYYQPLPPVGPTSRIPYGQWTQKSLPPAGGTSAGQPIEFKPWSPPPYGPQPIPRTPKPLPPSAPSGVPLDTKLPRTPLPTPTNPYSPSPTKAPIGRTPSFAEPKEPNPFLFPPATQFKEPPSKAMPPSAVPPLPPISPMTKPLGQPPPILFPPLPPIGNPNSTPPTPTQPPSPKPGQNIKPNQGELVPLYPTPILWRCEARWEESDPLGGNKVNMTNIVDLLSNFEPYLEKYTEPTSFSWVWTADSRGPDYPWGWKSKSPGTRTGIRWVYGTPDDIKYHVIRTGIEIPTNIKKEEGFLSRPQGGDLPSPDPNPFYKPGTGNLPKAWPIPNPNATGSPKDNPNGNRNKGMPNTSPAPSTNPNGGRNPQPKQDRKPIQDRPRVKQPKYNPPVIPNNPRSRTPFSPPNPNPSPNPPLNPNNAPPNGNKNPLPFADPTDFGYPNNFPTPLPFGFPLGNPTPTPNGNPNTGANPTPIPNTNTTPNNDPNKNPFPFPFPAPIPSGDCTCPINNEDEKVKLEFTSISIKQWKETYNIITGKWSLTESMTSVMVLKQHAQLEQAKNENDYATAKAAIEEKNSMGWFNKIYNFLGINRVLIAFNFLGNIHNAMMLSSNLTQTMYSMIDIIGQIVGLKYYNDAGELVDFNTSDLIREYWDNIMENLLGTDTYAGMKREWLKYNRIYQAASSIYYSMQSIFDSLRQGIEIIAEYTGKIGNAIKAAGLVFENAYAWMSEKATISTRQSRFWDNVRNGIESVEDGLNSIENVAGEVINIQEEFNQIQLNYNEFKDAIKDADEKATKASSAKTASQSPDIADQDKEPDGI